MFATYAPLYPELFITLSAIVMLVWGVAHRHEVGFTLGIIGVFVLIGAGLLIARHPSASQALFSGAFVDDSFARFMKVLTLAGSGFALILSFDFFRRERLFKFEYPVLVLLSTVGMMLTISANDLISLYLALEMQSLALYVLAAFHRDELRSTEAGLKYFVLGVLSSGLLLYGSSLVYGYTGATSFARIAETVHGNGASIGFIFGLVFVLAGMVFKLAAVPFHMWLPDVYEGAPTPVTAFFAGAPKIAAMAMLLRIVLTAFPQANAEWQQIVIAISLGSMIIGSLAAIGQNNIKRLLAYSAIGHMGYALIGLAVVRPGADQAAGEGIASVLVYMAIYLPTTIGSFACVLAMRGEKGLTENIPDLAGISKEKPFFAALFAFLLFSLAGIPWFAGFFAKFYVFNAAVQAKLYWLAIVGVLLSVISAFYYLRVIKVMYFDEPTTKFAAIPTSIKLVLALTSVFVFFFFVSPSAVKAAADVAAQSLF